MKILLSKKWILVSFCIGIILMIPIFFSCKHSSKFSIKYIQSSLPICSAWTTSPLNEEQLQELRQIFAQEFHYLASGAECYCFCSKDEKYVLKFFKMKHLIPKLWLKYLKIPGVEKYRFRKYEKRILRCHRLFQNYKMAYENCKEETGLAYIHLNKTPEMNCKINIVDRYGKRHFLDLDKFEFILQRKACLVGNHLNQLMQLGQKQEAVQAIHALLHHIVKQGQTGFLDQDSGIFHNYGFIGNQVIHFDIGRMQYSEENKEIEKIKKEIFRVGKKIKKWLEENQIALLPDFDKLMEDYLFSLDDSPEIL